jgi:hypothetical protein
MLVYTQRKPALVGHIHVASMRNRQIARFAPLTLCHVVPASATAEVLTNNRRGREEVGVGAELVAEPNLRYNESGMEISS